MSAPVILPMAAPVDPFWKQVCLPPSLTAAEVEARLGFPPARPDDGRVSEEWHFAVDGVRCAVWDYRGERWSAFGHLAVLRRVFPEAEPFVPAASQS